MKHKLVGQKEEIAFVYDLLNRVGGLSGYVTHNGRVIISTKKNGIGMGYSLVTGLSLLPFDDRKCLKFTIDLQSKTYDTIIVKDIVAVPKQTLALKTVLSMWRRFWPTGVWNKSKTKRYVNWQDITLVMKQIFDDATDKTDRVPMMICIGKSFLSYDNKKYLCNFYLLKHTNYINVPIPMILSGREISKALLIEYRHNNEDLVSVFFKIQINNKFDLYLGHTDRIYSNKWSNRLQ